MNTTRITGRAAIEAAREDESIQLHTYANAVDDGGPVDVATAEEIAREDAGLIWADVPDMDGAQ